MSGGAYTWACMTDILKAYLGIRTKLQQEKSSLESRLRDINKVLQAAAVPAAAVAPVRRGRPATAPAIKRRKRRMSPEARAKMAVAAKARWAKAKAAGKKRL